MRLSDQGEVTLVLPRYVPEAAGKLFAKANWAWVERQRVKIARNPSKSPFEKGRLENGVNIILFDQKFCSLKILVSSKNYSHYELQGDQLLCYLIRGSSKNTEQRSRDLTALVKNFYTSRARAYLTDRAEFWSAQLGVSFNDLRIKNTRTRWGSCSSKKNLNFNWRIMLAPREVVDYLVIHEVCHLKQMDHSPKFWKLVERLDPDFKVHKKWLREHQSRLLGFLG